MLFCEGATGQQQHPSTFRGGKHRMPGCRTSAQPARWHPSPAPWLWLPRNHACLTCISETTTQRMLSRRARSIAPYVVSRWLSLRYRPQLAGSPCPRLRASQRRRWRHIRLCRAFNSRAKGRVPERRQSASERALKRGAQDDGVRPHAARQCSHVCVN